MKKLLLIVSSMMLVSALNAMEQDSSGEKNETSKDDKITRILLSKLKKATPQRWCKRSYKPLQDNIEYSSEVEECGPHIKESALSKKNESDPFFYIKPKSKENKINMSTVLDSLENPKTLCRLGIDIWANDPESINEFEKELNFTNNKKGKFARDHYTECHQIANKYDDLNGIRRYTCIIENFPFDELVKELDEQAYVKTTYKDLPFNELVLEHYISYAQDLMNEGLTK